MNGQLVQDFKNYSNSFSNGFLKEWKANSILWTLKSMPKIFDDEIRFLKYLKNCLEMEGFLGIDIELIMGWLYERKDEL